MKTLMLITLIAGLTGPALAVTPTPTKVSKPAPAPAAEHADHSQGHQHRKPEADKPAPTTAATPIQKAAQRFMEGEVKNAEEITAKMEAAKQATVEAAMRAKEALTPLAKRLAKRAESEAPALIDATAKQRRASSKMVSDCLSALRRVVDEVAK